MTPTDIIAKTHTESSTLRAQECFGMLAKVSSRVREIPDDLRADYEMGFCMGAAVLTEQHSPLGAVTLLAAQFLPLLELVGTSADFPVQIAVDNREDGVRFSAAMRALCNGLYSNRERVNSLLKTWNETFPSKPIPYVRDVST